MGARSGNNYLSAMRKLKARVRFEGEWISDPITHPVLRHRGRLIASLYDAQSEHPGLMTYRLAEGDRIGWSWVQPGSIEEVRKRGQMLRAWAEQSGGVLGEPDEGNLALAAMAGAAELFRISGTDSERNLVEYYKRARSHDSCLATTLDGRRGGYGAVRGNKLEFAGASDRAVRLSGSAAISIPGGLADEVLILPEPPAREASAAIVCAIAANAPGVSFECAATSGGQGTIECRMVCDRVEVPSARIFLCGEVVRYDAVRSGSGIDTALLYHALIKQATRERIRLEQSASRAAGESELIAEIEGLLREAEEQARADGWGRWIPDPEPVRRAAELGAALSPTA